MNRLMAGYAQANPVPRPPDDWAMRLPRLQHGEANTDLTMDALRPPAPNADRYMEDIPSPNNLNQMPGMLVPGTLPVNVNPNDPRYLEWLLAMRQRVGL